MVTSYMSVTVAVPMLTNVAIPVASTIKSSGIVNPGIIVSTTVMICIVIAVFPFSSVAVHVTVVIPS